MAPRSKSAVVQVKARMREPLRARLEAAAKRRGVSLNTEVLDRLEESFGKEDAFGGPEVLNIVRLMGAAFLRGGERGAHSRRHSDWTASEWLNDPFCYQAAVEAVLDALVTAQPVVYESNHPDPAVREQHQRLHSFFAALAARGGRVFIEPKTPKPKNPRRNKEKGTPDEG